MLHLLQQTSFIQINGETFCENIFRQVHFALSSLQSRMCWKINSQLTLKDQQQVTLKPLLLLEISKALKY
ncbi:hypothetical protein FGO68_gene8444 [Halteria grandinella]|uniref:Uncharacterized protein n=1 Tax=Halteria grandinella TaxID=5974 RepID=A0A8J8NKG9_HALGN|nr:hypothetical protein FGO68_gene8444 [Halteria grandinella]